MAVLRGCNTVQPFQRSRVAHMGSRSFYRVLLGRWDSVGLLSQFKPLAIWVRTRFQSSTLGVI